MSAKHYLHSHRQSTIHRGTGETLIHLKLTVWLAYQGQQRWCFSLVWSWLPPSPVTSDMTPRWQGMPLEEVVTVRNTTKSQRRLSNSPHISISSWMVDGKRFQQSRRSSRFANWLRGRGLSVRCKSPLNMLGPSLPPPSSLPIILHVEMFHWRAGWNVLYNLHSAELLT